MNNGTAKRLDELCNDNNDAYREEVLYETWAEVPHGLAKIRPVPVAQRSVEAAQDAETTVAGCCGGRR